MEYYKEQFLEYAKAVEDEEERYLNFIRLRIHAASL